MHLRCSKNTIKIEETIFSESQRKRKEEKEMQKAKNIRSRICSIIEVGSDLDYASRAYDIVNAASIILNVAASIIFTYENLRLRYGAAILLVENITVAFFCIDYILRVFTAKYAYPEETEVYSILKYVISFWGIIDLLSFLPYYLPIFFPGGAVAFRLIRIIRIFRLFRINAYQDSLSVITEVLKGKRQQLISSVFIIVVLMIGSSLCMYSLEHEAQPEVFSNAFSGIWWATSTLLTVGYGDIYPITTWGKIFGIIISFLGVGMVAIPTGIISAGFVSQYSSIKRREEYGYEEDLNFIKIVVGKNSIWKNKQVKELLLPEGLILSVIMRDGEYLIPRGDVVLCEEDVVVIGAEPLEGGLPIRLKEIVLQSQNPWVGCRIKELDISKHSLIIMIKRGKRTMVPDGNTILKVGDKVFMHSKLHLKAEEIEV